MDHEHVKKEESLCPLSIARVMVEQGQDKHKHSIQRRQGWETCSHRWTIDSEILLSEHYKGFFLTWGWEKFCACH